MAFVRWSNIGNYLGDWLDTTSTGYNLGNIHKRSQSLAKEYLKGEKIILFLGTLDNFIIWLVLISIMRIVISNLIKPSKAFTFKTLWYLKNIYWKLKVCKIQMEICNCFGHFEFKRIRTLNCGFKLNLHIQVDLNNQWTPFYAN